MADAVGVTVGWVEACSAFDDRGELDFQRAEFADPAVDVTRVLFEQGQDVAAGDLSVVS